MATSKPAMSIEQALENIHEFGNGWYLFKASAAACWASMVFAMQTVCLIFQLTCVEDEWGLSTEWGTVITIFRVAGVLSSEILLGPAPEPSAMRHHVGCVLKHLYHRTEEKQAKRDHACKLKAMDGKNVTKLDFTSRFVQQCFTRDLHQRKHGLTEAGHQTRLRRGRTRQGKGWLKNSVKH